MYEILKKEQNLPLLIIVRYVCHSLQLGMSHETEDTLPRNIDFMVRETYNWFAHSTKRQKAYKNIYMTINSEVPHKILKVCDTSWISQEPAIRRIL
mgnify:CR=1 FL=1